MDINPYIIALIYLVLGTILVVVFAKRRHRKKHVLTPPTNLKSTFIAHIEEN